MNILEFQKTFERYKVFSLEDVLKYDPSFNRIQLDRWSEKGYIYKLRKGYYALAGSENLELFLFLLANRMYKPSYVSLETALSFYGFIPEGVYVTSSVCTRKTSSFELEFGTFVYRNINPALFFAYEVREFEDYKILLAEPEKALLDYFYLNPDLKAAEDFYEMRFNKDVVLENINMEKLQKYLLVFNKKALSKRVNIFLKFLHNA